MPHSVLCVLYCTHVFNTHFCNGGFYGFLGEKDEKIEDFWDKLIFWVCIAAVGDVTKFFGWKPWKIWRFCLLISEIYIFYLRYDRWEFISFFGEKDEKFQNFGCLYWKTTFSGFWWFKMKKFCKNRFFLFFKKWTPKNQKFGYYSLEKCKNVNDCIILGWKPVNFLEFFVSFEEKFIKNDYYTNSVFFNKKAKIL